MRIAKEGWPFVIGCAVAGLLFVFLARLTGSAVVAVLAGVAFLAAAFCAYFFRDPARVVPQDPKLILSPADGVVMEVIEGKDSIASEPVWILRIFPSVFAPHIQRSPVDGQVRAIRYIPGKFLDARDPKAAFENEQNRLEIVATNGSTPMVVTQIAGLIARRIVCWVKEGQTVKAGEQFGLIRFGSQVDMVLPKSVSIRVKAGDRVEAGTSIIGEIRP